MGVTPQQFHEMKARADAACGKRTVKYDLHLVRKNNGELEWRDDDIGSPKTAKRIRQSSKPLMNGLEKDYLLQLICGIPPSKIKAQAVTLKLANGLRYTPDFFAFHDGKIMAWEVKGAFAYEDSIVKLKVAAVAWPEIQFTLAWKKGGVWKEQRILA